MRPSTIVSRAFAFETLRQRHLEEVAVADDEVGGQARDEPPAEVLLVQLEGRVARVHHQRGAQLDPLAAEQRLGVAARRPRPRSG